MNIFERASRGKLRFPTSKGHLSTEDLWDLSLQDLDRTAKAINKKLKEEGEESFIAEKSEKSTELSLQIDILKHIISAKLAAQEASKKRSENLAKKAQIEDLILNKKSEDLKGKTVEELTAMLEELKD